MLCLLFASLALVGCDVHEMPRLEPPRERHPFTLHLDFNTDMPLYKDMEITRATIEPQSISTQHDIRYIVNVYHMGETRTDYRRLDTTFVFSKSDITDLNYTTQIGLYEGAYSIRVWADYVKKGSLLDKYYKTDNFEEIILMDRWNHSGSNDYRDAFRGHTYVMVEGPNTTSGGQKEDYKNEATIEMIRPMGKYKFVSTDVELFITRALKALQARAAQETTDKDSSDAEVVESRGPEINEEVIDHLLGILSGERNDTIPEGDVPDVRGPEKDDPSYDAGTEGDVTSSRAFFDRLLQSINLHEYKIVFKYYPYYMPCSFNMFTDRPASSWTGISFQSSMFSENEWEMTLGYDYIFVNGTETTLHIVVEVYDDQNELISATTPIQVPVVRSKLTVVKGKFLTSKATGGVTINPGFDGDDYNIEIK